MIKTILLVDKDPLYMDEVRRHFLGHGFRVLCARTRAEAERILETTRPDVLVTEIVLEHQDGGFCLAWKAKKTYPGIPVVMVSSVTWHTGLYFNLAGAEDRNWIRAEFLIDKPVRMEELESAVRTSMQPAKVASA